MSFEKFRYEVISMHEEDNNKHALQWFLNDIFESAKRNLIDKQRVREIFDDEIEKGLPNDALVLIDILKERLGL